MCYGIFLESFDADIEQSNTVDSVCMCLWAASRKNSNLFSPVCVIYLLSGAIFVYLFALTAFISAWPSMFV